MKEMKTTAQVLVDCLEAEGVDVMFGIPGEETLDLMFAIRDSKIRFIPVRHEQGAAFMADVYGRLTGRAGVCLSTLGPGATNLVTGVADAYLDGAPLVAITGRVGIDLMHLLALERHGVGGHFCNILGQVRCAAMPPQRSPSWLTVCTSRWSTR